MSARRRPPTSLIVGAAFGAFLLVSVWIDFQPGRAIGANFLLFFRQMLKILPCVFLLIGLFEVWVKRETVERHLGHGAGLRSYLWAVLLAATTVGGFHIALPVAHALHVKGARLGVVLTYLSCGAICRVPMTLFEASFLGWRFTCVRFAVSIPLVVTGCALLGSSFERRRYVLPAVDDIGT